MTNFKTSLHKEPISFKSETNGVISITVSGDNGWGIDKIFIPQNYPVTLASLSNEDRAKVWSHEAWVKLSDYINNLVKSN